MQLQVISKGQSIGTRVIDIETGKDINGIRSVKFSASVDDASVVEVGLCSVHVDATATGRFMVVDPLDGQFKAIAKIVFADGTEFVPG